MATDWLGSVMTGSASAAPVRFLVGDTVDVLNAVRLPRVEQVIGTGVVERVMETETVGPLYWVRGFPCARTASVLRLVWRAR